MAAHRAPPPGRRPGRGGRPRGRRRGRAAALEAVERGRPERGPGPAHRLVRSGRADAQPRLPPGPLDDGRGGGAPGGAHRDRRGHAGRALAPGRGAAGPRAALGRRDHLRGGPVAGHVPGRPAPGDRALRLGPRVRDRDAGLRGVAGRRRQGPRHPGGDRRDPGRRRGGPDRPRAAAVVAGDGRRWWPPSSTCRRCCRPWSSSRCSSAPSRCATRRCRPRSWTWPTAPAWRPTT